jgi:ATP-dependent exoDNAse (exonuclease V) alpha subunit
MGYRERIEGELEGFSFQADDGGYAVARLKPSEGANITLVGPIGHLPVGSHLRLEGQWSEHARYGKQFRVRSYLVEDPKTLIGLERYLSSGSVRGLGIGLAKRVVEHFGLDTLRVLDEEPDRLREVNGIGKKRVESWKNMGRIPWQSSIVTPTNWLAVFGESPSRARTKSPRPWAFNSQIPVARMRLCGGSCKLQRAAVTVICPWASS